MSSSLRSTLHGRGKRMTPQRQLVLDAVRQLEHATPEQVCAHVQRTAPAVNITTVYRTLELLSELGLVRHTHLGHGAPAYSVREHEHLHLVCHRCGRVVEAPRDLLDGVVAAARSRWGFELDAAHVALSGRCGGCAAVAEPPTAAAPASGPVPASGAVLVSGPAPVSGPLSASAPAPAPDRRVPR